MTNEEVLKQIVEEVFSTTGQKVDASDPVVIFALFSSVKLKQSLAAAVAELQATNNKVIDVTLTEAKREFTKHVDKTASLVIDSARAAARTQIQAELPAARKSLSDLHAKLLKSLRSDGGHQASGGGISLRALFAFFFVLSAIGYAAMSYYGKKPALLGPAEIEQIKLGKEWQRVAPKLDPETKAKFAKTLQSNYEQQ